uniref:Uncharacterized protein n=1 Tax=Arundo donax TaxID=35708 RepID=A0A0A9H9T6_ARUDO
MTLPTCISFDIRDVGYMLAVGFLNLYITKTFNATSCPQTTSTNRLGLCSGKQKSSRENRIKT